jgi:PAS domain S-box-containing protein
MSSRKQSDAEELRRRAEELYRRDAKAFEDLDPRAAATMLQELQIARIELELQNEELLEAQKELETARMRFARLYNNAPVGYVALDPAGVILQANATFAAMVRREGAELAGAPFAQLLSAEAERIFRARFRAFFRNPGGKSMEVAFSLPHEQSFHGRLEAVPHHTREPHDRAADFDELLVTVSDISDRKHVENQLREQREYLATTLHSIGDAVISTDSAGRITAMNSVAEHLTGWNEIDARGKGLREVFRIVNSLTGEEAENPVARVLAEGKVVGLANHTMLLSRDGARYHIADSAAPIRREGEEIMGVVLVFRDVSEEYEKDRLLSEHRHRLARAQQIAHLGSWELALDTSALYWSDETYRIFGLTPGEIDASYETFLEMVHPDDRDRVDRAYRESVEQGLDSYEIEHRIVRRDGEVRYVHEKCEHQRNDAGAIERSIGMVHDITATTLAAIALKKSKETAERYLNIAAEIILSLDTEGRIIILNDSGHRLLGYEPGELIGVSWIDCCIPESKRLAVRGIFEKIKQGEAVETATVENAIITREGATRIIRWHNTVVRDESGRITGTLSSGEDITERTQAEQRVAAERERLAVTLRSIGDGVITTDTRGRVELINDVAEELTGWSRSEARGKPLSTVFLIVNEFTRKPCENPVDKVLARGEVIELANHTMLVARDGTERIIADSGAPIKDDRGETVGVVLVFRDMTEKQKLLDAVNRTDKLDSLGILAGGIAHDFNNLLSGIFGYIDLAREASTANKTALGYIDKALTAFNRAKDLTMQLLTFSKGGAPIRAVRDLSLLIKENASFALSGSNVTCDYRIAPDVWRGSVDENQIGQVISNIVINAQQAMPLGGTITISAQNVNLAERAIAGMRAGAYVKLSIADTGAGIPPEHLTRIFDPFYTTKQKGNGLGLATCYSIIQKHDGCIEAESTVGKGSVFHIYLPAVEGEAAAPVARDAIAHRGSGAMLIMDDEDFIREIAAEMLHRMGYRVLEARDGAEAMRLCEELARTNEPFAGALFDLTIPGGMGGKETVAIVRKRFPDLPVFATSGYSEDPVMARPWQFGFTDSIRKPFRKRELEVMLQKHLPEQ